jgi:methylmalonyl-CoA/ethylmalonyl-CoA epimerase
MSVLLEQHHVGIAVRDIEQATRDWTRRFGCEVCTPVIHVATQTAYIRFLRQPGSPVFLELVSPDRPDSKLSNALNKGGGLNHLCYATDNIQQAVRHLSQQGMAVLESPVATVAFPGRLIAWLIGEDLLPIELVERGSPGEP